MPAVLPPDVLALFDALSRRPDVEAPELVAVDAADRLVLVEARGLLAAAGQGDVAVLDDDYGALALGALALGAPDVRVATDTVTSERAILLNAADVAASGVADLGASSVVDRLTVHAPLDPAVVSGARVVLARLPRSLDALAELADLVADHAASDVVLLATGRLKHMSRGMNGVLAARFGEVTATRAHGKARALVARRPVASRAGLVAFPRRARIDIPAGAGVTRADGSGTRDTVRLEVPSVAHEGGARGTLPLRAPAGAHGAGTGGTVPLVVVAHGAAFAGTTLDIGTRALLDVLDGLVRAVLAQRRGTVDGAEPSGSTAWSRRPAATTTGPTSTTSDAAAPAAANPAASASAASPPAASASAASASAAAPLRVLDLGCGTGVLATVVALRVPDASVVATDRSAAAVLSAAATADANGVGDRVTTLRDDAAASVPDGSVDIVVCNPPFHVGAAVSTDIAEAMFRAAARVLRPGGELWVVWNSHLRYRPSLERVVGPTTQVSRTPKFTVTRSVRR